MGAWSGYQGKKKKKRNSLLTVDHNCKNKCRWNVFYFIRTGKKRGKGEGFRGMTSIFRACRKNK